ncbi:MAG: TonB-dependent receptor [Chitinophagales bacterium]|nr:TonB-dependent receptor [Chitinophagales bacterium]
MTTSSLRLLFICLAATFTTTVYSQATITGKVIDSATGSPLALATVSVFAASDTSLINYRLANEDGIFKVSGIPLNIPCRMVISFSGYAVKRLEFTMTEDKTLDLGSFALATSAKSLEEIMVRAERPPVSVRKDTIEFNASSFKTLPAALVEDLLKRLPGVQVDKAGNITANGKRVNKILVDGKAFFGDDPKMATRNLPASVIDKVQLTDDKEAADRDIDFNPNDMGKVINLTLKKGIKKGWFGRTYAGGGTKDRYEAGGIFNIYRDTMQLSLVGFSNNIGRSGFSIHDISGIGGFDRSGFNSLSIGTRAAGGGFAINGISFGGMEPGIARSSGIGFNLNHAPNKKRSFFSQYFIGETSAQINERINKRDFYGDTVVTSLTNSSNKKRNLTHNLNAGMNLKPDSLHLIQFKAGLRTNFLQENINSHIDISNQTDGDLTEGRARLLNQALEGNYNHEFFFTRKSPSKAGRMFQLNHWLAWQKSKQDFTTESVNQYFQPLTYFDSLYQLRQSSFPNLSIIALAQFAEPLGKNWTLKYQTRLEFNQDQQEANVLGLDPMKQDFTIKDSSQSNALIRDRMLAAPGMVLQYMTKKLSLTFGFTGQYQKYATTPLGKASNQDHLFNLLPNLQMAFKGFNFRLGKSINLPPLSQLLAVKDSSSPFQVRFGNPNLQPSRTTNLSLNKFMVSKDRTMDYNLYLNANFTNGDLIFDRRFGSDGTQTLVPVNRDGTREFRVGTGITKEFKKNQSFQVSLQARATVRYTRQSILMNEVESKVSAFQWEPGFSMTLNWKNILEFRPEYRFLGTSTSYTDKFFTNLNAGQHYIQSDLTIRWPKDIIWENNIEYRYSNTVSPGLPKDNLLWNAGVSLQFLKEKKGMVKLGVYDLLNRNNNLTRFATGNQIIDQEVNILNRYFLLTFTYSIRNIGVRSQKDRFQLF